MMARCGFLTTAFFVLAAPFIGVWMMVNFGDIRSLVGLLLIALWALFMALGVIAASARRSVDDQRPYDPRRHD